MNFKINAILAFWLTGLIAVLWLVPMLCGLELAGEIKGATIVVFTLIAQYFFRKKPPRGTE